MRKNAIRIIQGEKNYGQYKLYKLRIKFETKLSNLETDRVFGSRS